MEKSLGVGVYHERWFLKSVEDDGISRFRANSVDLKKAASQFQERHVIGRPKLFKSFRSLL